MSPADLAALRALLPGPAAAWAARLAALPGDEASALVGLLYPAWVAGELGPALFDDAPPPLEADRRLGRLFRDLPAPLTAPLRVERPARSEADVRRWAWAPGWYLCQQDEDLFVMGEDCAHPLLDEAAAGCTKREYVLGIVEHGARDRAYAALFRGDEAVRAALAAAAALLAPARAARADALADYLARLADYAAPGKVRPDEARRRVFDLRRCHPDPHDEPALRREGSAWVAPFADAGGRPAELVIDAGSGRMSARSLGRERGRRRT